MIEYALLPIFIGAAAALMPQPKKNDKKKIQTIFKNIGFYTGTGDEKELPKFKKKMPIMEEEKEIGTRYVYDLPLGLSALVLEELEKKGAYFSDGLNRPCLVEFKKLDGLRKHMVISVFNWDIPERFPYKKIPAPKKDEAGKVEWTVPLGRTLEEVIYLNMEHIPHMTVAGVTRFGKTVFLKVLMTYLIEHHPDDAEFYIFDLKGGLEFSEYERLRQVKGVAGDYIETFLMVTYLHNLMHQDLAFFKERGIRNIVNSPLNRRVFIVVDEAAQLAAEGFMTRKLKDITELEPYLHLLPEELQKKGTLKELLNLCQYYFSEIARLGGGLGYRLIYCTQYPTADTLPRQIKMNSDAKVTFRLPTGYASEVAIDMRGAEKLPGDIKGRALYKSHDLRQMQAPLLTDEEMWERLEKFQVPVLMKGETAHAVEPAPEKAEPAGGYPEHTGRIEIRDKGAASKNPRVRFE